MATNIERGDKRLIEQNKVLRNALESLIESIEEDNSNNVDTEPARQAIRKSNKTERPWECEGYDTKEEWLAEKRQN